MMRWRVEQGRLTVPPFREAVMVLTIGRRLAQVNVNAIRSQRSVQD